MQRLSFKVGPGWFVFAFIIICTLLLMKGTVNAQSKHEYDCVIGAQSGYDEADLVTATEIVCEALRDEGVSLGTPVDEQGDRPAYSVSLEKLGSSTLVVVREHNRMGKAIHKRRTQLKNLEELLTAAPRVAKSIRTGQGLEQTRKRNNILAPEGKKQQRLWGEFSWGFGASGLALLGSDAGVAPGGNVTFQYETDHFAVGPTMVFGGNDDMSLFAAGIGARWIPWTTDFSPYVGGGFGVLSVDLDTWDDDNRRGGDGFGLSIYAEAGVELLRTYSTQFLIGVRADLPTFSLESYGYTGSGFDLERVEANDYVVPLSLNATILW